MTARGYRTCPRGPPRALSQWISARKWPARRQVFRHFRPSKRPSPCTEPFAQRSTFSILRCNTRSTRGGFSPAAWGLFAAVPNRNKRMPAFFSPFLKSIDNLSVQLNSKNEIASSCCCGQLSVQQSSTSDAASYGSTQKLLVSFFYIPFVWKHSAKLEK